MSLIVGNTLVKSEELHAKYGTGELTSFMKSISSNPNATLEFSTGLVTANDTRQTPGFTKIAIGKPLSIEILTVYTGKMPNVGFLGILSGNPDLLVSSAVKSSQTFDVAPRAINQLVQKVSKFQYIEPSALTEGCPIVYYTPSLADDTLFCSFELVVNSFDDSTIKQISGLFKSAVGLPVFAPAAAYLIAGSVILNIFKDIGNALLKRDPFLRADLPLRFNTPGVPISFARAALLYNDEDSEEFKDYETGSSRIGPGRNRTSLFHKKTKEEYHGSSPYVIANIDGRKREGLDKFSPKLASAALIEQFYGAKDTTSQVINALNEAMELYNDFSFRQKVEAIKKQLDQLPQDSADYKVEKSLYDAYNENIRNDLFKFVK